MLMRRHADDMAICNVGTLAYQHVLFLNLHLNTLTAEFLHSLINGLVVFGSNTEFGQVERGKGIVGVQVVLGHGTEYHAHTRGVVGDGIYQYEGASGLVVLVGV